MLIYLQMIESEADKSKFERLYLRYRGLMFSVAMRLLSNEQDAEDAVHQAFLSIIEHLNKITEIDCPKTRSYVVIITEHKAIDLLRAGAKTVPIDFEASAVGIEIPAPGDGGLADAMAKLPARYREVLLLRYDNGYSTREIAQMFRLKPGAVQKLLWRAKEALRNKLDEEAANDA